MQDQQTPQAGWQFDSEDTKSTDGGESEVFLNDSISWSASEYVAHEKNFGWYIAAAGVTLVIAAVVYFITAKSWFSSLMILVGGGVFIAAAARPPRVLNYSVDDHSLKIGTKTYPLSGYKSFSVIEEGPIQSILLIPLERFMPGMSIYYDPKDEDRIVTVLGASLPYEDRQAPLVDKLMRKIRF